MLPIWTALTAYGLYARVTKVVTDGTVWSVQTPGTSGATEPTWPTVNPWTVVDGTVTWGLGSSFRTDAVAGVVDLLTTFMTSNPTLLKSVAAARPKSASNMSLPGVFVGDRSESSAQGQELRTRTLAGLVVVAIDKTPDNVQAMNRLDILVDALEDLFTSGFHAISGYSILELTGVNDVSFVEGTTTYQAVEFSLGNTYLTEGRD